MTEHPTRRPISRNEWLLVVASTVAASVVAAAWSWRNNAMLNYGDAVAHLHIARRVFDFASPWNYSAGLGLAALAASAHAALCCGLRMWANGVAGLIPSALAYLAGCAGIYRLARHWLNPIAAVIALMFFALNPNLLYLQTTAMTEPLFLCEMIWLSVWLVEWRTTLDNDPTRAARLLPRIAVVLIAAVFTRYDGWILAFLAWTSIGIVQLRRGTLRSRTFWIASAAVIAAPLVWFAYNAIVFGDWLNFARGPLLSSGHRNAHSESGIGTAASRVARPPGFRCCFL